jgi:hypothetical protein
VTVTFRTTYRIGRPWLRYVVYCVSEYTTVEGRPLLPFIHPERSFWRYSAAATYAQARADGELPEWTFG